MWAMKAHNREIDASYVGDGWLDSVGEHVRCVMIGFVGVHIRWLMVGWVLVVDLKCIHNIQKVLLSLNSQFSVRS